MNLRLKHICWLLLTILFPLIARAEDADTLSFAPPASDTSVTFLGNIFGVVDGVLHGTGSQIMGTMFGVFNAAVLALGGIVIMYIILVSTMNTAHEGQMLGQKWSSIWVPVRATIGLALLIPKSSGYCLMQIFVMWVVLQGVGVADKIWGAALDYLNRGGVIIQANMAPNISMGADNGAVATGAAVILYGQVCMVGLQTQLETVRDGFLDAKDKESGPCAGTPSANMQAFCDTSVPDFINTVDTVSTYDASADASKFDQLMPNFDSSSIYAGLNGICGTIHWNALSESDVNSVDDLSTISDSDLQTIKKSRAAAIEQMYITLSTTARTIVSNDPQINGNGASDDDTSAVADDQFGVPQMSGSSRGVCGSTSDDCPNWGSDPTITTPVLLDGTELQDGMSDYNAVMMPTLTLIQDSKSQDNAEDERKFINEAKERGWIMAGSYFFDLARINGSATENQNLTDTNTGLDSSSFELSNLTTPFGTGDCSTNYAILCEFFNKDATRATQVASLIDGTNVIDPVLSPPKMTSSSFDTKNTQGVASSLVYGYANNAMIIDLAEQEGTSGPTINLDMSLDLSGLDFKMPSLNDGCGYKWKLPLGIKICVGQAMKRAFYDNMIKPLVEGFMYAVIEAIKILYQYLVVYPMIGFTYIFVTGVEILGTDGVNPIIALAKMGITYINFAMNTWVIAITGAVVGGFFPPLYSLLMMVMPLFLAWVGIMLAIGFITAYFIPFVPYMIFTFGSIAWLIAVIEAMVAAPIVALGVAHPEGHDAMGKSEQGLMILLNVFLRPGMMIIGYIGAIALSFVAIWIMNAGFDNVLSYLKSDEMWGMVSATSPIPWAQFFGFFFAALIYTMLYLIITQKAFSLIAVLPDKVLRWIGGAPEGVGEQAQQWGEEAKSKIGEAGTKTGDAGGAMQKQAAGHALKGAKKVGIPTAGSGKADLMGGGKE